MRDHDLWIGKFEKGAVKWEQGWTWRAFIESDGRKANAQVRWRVKSGKVAESNKG
jgi:hypothetical protein